MSDQPISHAARTRDNRPSNDEAAKPVFVTAEEITGPVATPNPTRSGEDTRRRGWFWHWNSIVTQYAPLIGLKGVGLLNSYTVWTDRRDESPHRGYAFPSQQSEADFYGEDRAELITINKLLVALDLIEIRKEMVLRLDEQGRRWKVPHNFYRVKDHDDGSSLTSRDVLNVAELADRDGAVYRYVRRVFSPKFAPIDHNNVWAQILEEVRQTEVWQRLATKAAKEEQRASDRTKAGHAARKGSFILPVDVDKATTSIEVNDSSADGKTAAQVTIVATTNNGSNPDVEESNNGSTPDLATSVAPSNSALPTYDDQTNRTYNQYPLTTTTTTPDGAKQGKSATKRASFDTPGELSRRPVTQSKNTVTGRQGAGPNGQAGPSDAPGEARAVQAFEDANGRRATAAERHLLTGLSKRFDPAARRAQVLHMESGWSWVTAGIYEAVEAGSTFVAPRRLREILTRWERDGLPEEERAPGNDQVISHRHVDHTGQLGGAERAVASHRVSEHTGYELNTNAPDFDLPHGFGSRRTWSFAVSLLETALERSTLARLVRASAIVGYANGEVTIAVPEEDQAEQLAGEYRDLVARKISEAMRRPIRIAVLIESQTSVVPGGDSVSVPAIVPSGDRVARPSGLENPNFMIAECGMPSAQVWAAIIDEIVSDGEVSRLNVETWLRSSQLIGRGSDGALIVGAPHVLAQRRIESRFRSPLVAAVEAVLGSQLRLEIVVARDWLAEHAVLGGVSGMNEIGAA